MNFSEKLKQALEKLNLKQTQLVGLTGKSKASISQYLSGKQVPPTSLQREIALSLGLNADYFDSNDDAEILKPIKRMSVAEAAKLLGASRDTVYDGLRQGVFPWGYAIKTTEQSWTYIINADRFKEIELINSIRRIKDGE